MIRAEEFTFQYSSADEPAIEEVSFDVEEGDVLGVLGPVEAGKTSLSMALAGFVPEITGGWTRGNLSVAGRDPREAADDRVAMVFEDYGSQLTQLRLIDEVIAPLSNTGHSRAEARERARELLEEVRLEDVDEEKFTWELSGGQQQRLAIAAALAIDPEVLIFDTATDMLDPEGQADVASLISSLAGETTLVVTENDPDALVGIADDLLVLEDGEAVAFGPADDLLRDADLLESAGVGTPTCLDVGSQVGFDGSPITINEFHDRYLDWASAPGAKTPEESGETAAVDGGVAATPGAPDVGTFDLPDRFGEPIIEAESVTFEYPDGTTAVSGIDLTVRAGEVHAILGGNGAGKSTLSKLLVGLMDPTTGEVTVDGTDTTDATARDLAESIGIALQDPDEQISRGTVESELRAPLERRQYDAKGPFGLLGKTERYDGEFIDERVEEVRELVGLDPDRMDEDPVFLPRGERRLVTMASALAPDPAAIVLDEPTAGVDARTKRVVRDAIERLTNEGKGVVLIDHDVGFVCEVADRVTVLEDGTSAIQGPTEAVFDRAHWEWLSERYMRPPRAARMARRVGTEDLTPEDLIESLSRRVEVRP